MGHQIPNDVHVRADWAKVRSGEVQIFEPPHSTRIDKVSDVVDGSVESENMSNHEEAIMGIGQVA